MHLIKKTRRAVIHVYCDRTWEEPRYLKVLKCQNQCESVFFNSNELFDDTVDVPPHQSKRRVPPPVSIASAASLNTARMTARVRRVLVLSKT